MEIFDLTAGICSIIGLFVSLFVATKVLRLSNTKNSGELQQGDGTQKVAKGRAAFADHHSSATYNDYSAATIIGEIDELPVLTEEKYPIIIQGVDKYSLGVSDNTCNLVQPPHSNLICFTVDFSNIVSKPETGRWIGYAIKSLPMRDWRSFVKENYALRFDYVAVGNIKEIWIEVTNKHDNKKIYKKKINVSPDSKTFKLDLYSYVNIVDDWKYVDEICFVFFPEYCRGEQGSIFITDLSIQKI